MEKKSARYLTLISLIIFVLLMLPVLALSFVNRASGDDYGYGVYTRAAWIGSHSLIAVGKAIIRTVRQYYYGWQGTWFSITLFALQPEVFGDGGYVIVSFLMLFIWCGSTFYLFWQILGRNKKFDKWSYLTVTLWFLIISIEFIPSTKSSIYWFNGCAHYMVPFAMCQMTAAWLLQYSGTYRKRTLAGIIVFMTLLGGSNYQASLFPLITACYVMAAGFLLKKDRRIFLLGIPVLTELAGLIISMKAPGNKVRAGEEFGLSLSKALQTIGLSFWYGIRDIGTYLKERPLVFAGLLLLFLLLFLICYSRENIPLFSHPVWLALGLFCLYSAMQAPAIYAGVEVSRGVLNMNFQVFLLMSVGILFILAERLAEYLKKVQVIRGRKYAAAVMGPGILLGLLLLVLCRSNIKTGTSYVCLDYMTSGQASDYKEQMDLQTRLMEEEGVKDVVLPFINDEQGPLMHMPVTADKEAWTNKVTREFYGKDSVVAMERPRWMEEYGNK